MYANDPSLATARLMMQGALAFAPFFERHLGLAKHSMTTSHPAAYVVHRDSQRTPEQVSHYLSSVHAMVRGASGGKCKAYFGSELSGELRTWSAAERAAQFDPEVALAAFDTPEVAIDPVALARAVRQRIAAEPRIEVRPRHEVLSVQDDRGLEVSLKTADGLSRERFTHVVNALWDGRFAIDEKLGLRPERSWMHRLKYGVSFRLAAGTKAGKLTMIPHFADLCADRIIPLVTLGVPLYHGQDQVPATLECLRTQTYQNLDVLISVDADDQASAAACESYLRRDSRFRMHVQTSRLGWAGNTNWTMRERRGEFYIFQQHDDQVSPTYVADLVEAAMRYPNTAICYAEVQYTGFMNQVMRGVPLLSEQPVERVLRCLKFMDHSAFRGLIRGTALASTSGLLLSDFDPFDSYGTEMRFLTELARLGECRFVPGPIYYKHMHGANLHVKREKWTEDQKCLA